MRLVYIGLFIILAAWWGLRAGPTPYQQPFAQAENVETIITNEEGEEEVVLEPITTEFELVIDKISVAAPVLLNVPGADRKTYLAALRQGVAHYQGTALPDEIGNAVIFGHSATDKQKRGPYSQIFNQLDQLAVDDEIILRRADGSRLTYKISSSRQVDADDTDALKQGQTKTLTLITCWPVGDRRHRLVVTAEQVPTN